MATAMAFSTDFHSIKLDQRLCNLLTPRARRKMGSVNFSQINGGISISKVMPNFGAVPNVLSRRVSFTQFRDNRSLPFQLSASTTSSSGLDESVKDKKKSVLSLGDVKISIGSRDDETIQVRVDLTGEQTEKAFDDMLMSLARTAPPIPGFRRSKGGKTSSNVPKGFLLQALGRDRVTKFLIQELITTTIEDFVEREQIKVKTELSTTQTAEELESAFSPGSDFGFDATLQLENEEDGAKDEEKQSEMSTIDV
ncbi:Trigger factor [Zostera marina]|uniref:peptidylprolyl isomerase n=1 Tax=Zostera marina TaxID=29655 RepID=A0A0K9Q1Z2_ZOSMR|nr:Trigger factor [Zostera marina]